MSYADDEWTGDETFYSREIAISGTSRASLATEPGATQQKSDTLPIGLSLRHA